MRHGDDQPLPDRCALRLGAGPVTRPSRPKLSAADRARLFDLAQYLNLAEMKGYCDQHGLPLYIHVERPGRTPRRTGDRDRKDVVLQRILAYAVDGKRNGPTIYPASVLCDRPLPKTLTSRTRVHFGQYEKQNKAFLRKLRELTDGEFQTGMIARLVLRDFWTAGTAPTLNQFAQAWRKATREHVRPRPEGAYLVDLARGEGRAGWKEKRRAKAREALEWLQRFR